MQSQSHLPYVISARAETALRQIRWTTAQLQRAAAEAQRVPRSRRRLLDQAGYGSGSVLRSSEEDALSRIVSIAEEFCIVATGQKIRGTLSETPALTREALLSVERSFERTWKDRVSRWKRWYGFDASTNPGFQRFLIFVEARNAILHGGGRLTHRQLSQAPQLAADLTSVGLSLTGDRITVSASAIATCADSTVSFIRWLDEQLKASIPMP